MKLDDGGRMALKALHQLTVVRADLSLHSYRQLRIRTLVTAVRVEGTTKADHRLTPLGRAMASHLFERK